MKITVLAIGSRGDVWPYLALALKDAGHEVRFAAHHNFEQEVRIWGLEYTPVLGDYREIVSGELGAWLADEEPKGQRVKMEETGQNPLLLACHFLSTVRPLMKKTFADALEACRGSDAILCSATADDTVRERAAAVGRRIRAEDGVERAVESFRSRVAGGQA